MYRQALCQIDFVSLLIVEIREHRPSYLGSRSLYWKSEVLILGPRDLKTLEMTELLHKQTVDLFVFHTYFQEQSFTFQSALIFSMLPNPVRSYSLLGFLLNLPYNFSREQVISHWLERCLQELAGTCPLPDVLPSGSGVCIVKKGSQLFTAEPQKRLKHYRSGNDTYFISLSWESHLV